MNKLKPTGPSPELCDHCSRPMENENKDFNPVMEYEMWLCASCYELFVRGELGVEGREF